MKRFIKKIIKSLIKRSAFLRRFIIRLYNAVFSDDSLPGETYDAVFTEKATCTGSTVDYFGSFLMPKEQRICELKRIFYGNCHYYLDMDNPKTFNQKIQWLKMNYYHEDFPRAVDKAEFKNYIKEKIGDGYTVPLYGVWEKENEIDFDALPNCFVLKSTVQSDGKHIIVIHDKSFLDYDRLKTVLSSWLQPKNNLCSSFCSAYSKVKPRIIAEKYIQGVDNSLVDYKFMCFNGKTELLFVVSDRAEDMSVNFYDLNWNLLPFTRKYPNAKHPVLKPKNFDKMVEIANILAKPFPFVRVDFYELPDGTLLIGELTFYPGGGYEPFQPVEWDYKLGDMLCLPEANI